MERAGRVVTYRLLGGIFAECPSHELIRALAEDSVVPALAETASPSLRSGLLAIRAAAAGESPEALRTDYTALFVGPRIRLTPPFESVYRSTDRQVMGEAHLDVTRAFAAHGVGFDGIAKRPADHIALELQFVATLLERNCEEGDAGARDFLDRHLLAWGFDYAKDLGQRANTDFWRGAAAALAGLLESEQRLEPLSPGVGT